MKKEFIGFLKSNKSLKLGPSGHGPNCKPTQPLIFNSPRVRARALVQAFDRH
jgi:hypothetical protein